MIRVRLHNWFLLPIDFKQGFCQFEFNRWRLPVDWFKWSSKASWSWWKQSWSYWWISLTVSLLRAADNTLPAQGYFIWLHKQSNMASACPYACVPTCHESSVKLCEVVVPPPARDQFTAVLLQSSWVIKEQETLGLEAIFLDSPFPNHDCRCDI